MKGLTLVVILVVVLFCDGGVCIKECTNIPTQLASHTFRAQLLSSNNETWKEEMFSHYHLTPTDDSAWASLLPRKILGEDSDAYYWAITYRNIKNGLGSGGGGSDAGNFLREMSLEDVRLDPNSFHWRAQQTNLEYLLILDVDRLVWSFRKTAGLDTPGVAYGGWESPDVELRGHFVGHYLSASAQMWASTYNETLKRKMSAVVSALSACQEKMGTGYLSAFPTELFDRFESIKPVWAPYYTIHKILAGLLDQFSFAGDARALKMVTWMVEYFYNRVKNVILKQTIEQHWESLNEEVGGMNDVLYRLYAITKDQKHLLLAHLFDKPCFLGMLALEVDSLSDFHCNTHIPLVIGSQVRYEVTGDPLYKTLSTFFMDAVNSSHAYATGGTSVSEFWRKPKRLADSLQTENEESCTTYNMLKVSRHLFTWSRELAYADYYERALTNGVLGIQRGAEPGKMIYMLPLGKGVSKARSYHGWGTIDNSFWCCYGTGVESFSKLGDSIYFEEDGEQPTLYIIQYISSSLNWKSAQILLSQKVDPVISLDPYLRVAFTFSSKGGGQSSRLNLRIPGWTSSNGAGADLNGQKIPLPPPGNFLPVSVKPGDQLTLQLPLTLRAEAIKDDRPEYASLQAILYGPYLLAGLTSGGDWDLKSGSAASLSDWITPIPANYQSQLISLSQKPGNATFLFTNSNGSITMEPHPEAGTDAAVHATFRLVPTDPKSSKFSSPENGSAIGQKVTLEPIDYPGAAVIAPGAERSLQIGNSDAGEGSPVFNVLRGLDGEDGSVSMESASHGGCFVSSGADGGGRGRPVKLSCESSSSDADAFRRAASFVLGEGRSQYHPISFVAKGAKRDFLLHPLMSLRDESYTVYFNFRA